MPLVEMKNEIVPRTDPSIEPRTTVARVVKIGGRVLMVIGALWVLKVGTTVLLNPLVLLGGVAVGAGAYWFKRKNREARDNEGSVGSASDSESGTEPARVALPAPTPRVVSKPGTLPARESEAEQEARREEALRALKRRIDAESDR